MQDTKAYKKYTELACIAIKKYPSFGKTDMGVIRRKINKGAKFIHKAYKTAKEIEASNEPLPKAFVWIYDNYYLISEKIQALYINLKKAPNLCASFSKEGKDAYLKLPKYYLAFYDYLCMCDERQNDCSISAFTSCCDKFSKERPEFSDFYSFETLFSCAVIVKICDICKELLDKPYTSASDSFAMELGKCINSLRFLSTYSFDEAFESCLTEEYLKMDPSGFYNKMSKETKDLYRRRVSVLSRKAELSETEYVKQLLEKCRLATNEKQKHIGAFLVAPPTNSAKTLYFILMALLVLIPGVFLFRISPIAIILIFPLWEAAKQVCDKLFSIFIKSTPCVRLDLKEIPDTDRVLVVITTLLTGKSSDNVIFSRLENMYLSNGMKNIYFAILADLPDSTEEKTPEDKNIFDNACTRISALNQKYNNSFFLFMRNRSYSQTQGKFMGHERKRGAVCSLVEYLCQSNTHSSFCGIMPDSFLCSTIKYILTLDSDTNLPNDTVRTLAGIMLHPLNRPVIDKKRAQVTDGYGLLQPIMSPDLSSSAKTSFSRIMCGIGGIDIYSFAGFDTYQSIFDSGIFCGKGMFDKDVFESVINKTDFSFPNEYILSHDILEGERLRTALCADIKLTDGFPKNVFSYLSRKHRWIRGDVQNLLFMKGFYKNSQGKTVKNNFSPLSKFKLFDNFRRACVPIFVFAALIVSNFLAPFGASLITIGAVFYLILPFAFDLSGIICTLSFQCAARRFFSKGVTTGIGNSLKRLLFHIAMLPIDAITSLDAILKSLYRAIASKKNLLEWVTAAQSDNSSSKSLIECISRNIIGAVLGTVIFLFSPYSILKLVGLLWFIFPLWAYFSSNQKNPKPVAPSEQERKLLIKYCTDMWSFFEHEVNVDESFLPSDNIQLFPCEIKAHRTSPTNIGLYLLSVLSARDFKFISTENMYARLDNTLSSIEKMEKWKGHLYNWYDTQTLCVLKPYYISSVDSGNFLGCLICLGEGLKEYVNEHPSLLDIIARINRLIDATDISAIYNYHRNLFAIGVTIEGDVEKMSENCYDMFMSEARILSYIAVSRRAVPIKHWASLSRPCVKHSNRIGIASWTGTAFEYFMPCLFLPIKKNSVMYEAMRFAFYRQRARKAEAHGVSVWGISESGYFAFDSEMNYRYQAFGIPELGLKRGLEKDLVISAYSSFLAMCLNINLPMVNLSNLESLGMYGKYGFYEAYDFTPDRSTKGGACVKSYMSHHIGMSLIAGANACLGNTFVKRFMSDAYSKSASELLEEKIPVNVVVRKVRHRQPIKEYDLRQKRHTKHLCQFNSQNTPTLKAISDGQTGIIASDAGFVKLYSEKYTLNIPDYNKYDVKRGFFSFFKYKDRIYSPSYFPLEQKQCKYYFEYNNGSLGHICKDSELEAKTEYTVLPDYSVISAKLTIKCKKIQKQEKIIGAFCFEPMLMEEREYFSHPSFNNLFVTASYDKERKIIIYERKNRKNPSEALYLAVGFHDSTASLDFSVSKENTLCANFGASDYNDIFSFKTDSKERACIHPLMLIKTPLLQYENKFTANLLLSFSHSKQKAVDCIIEARGASIQNQVEKAENISALLSMSAGITPQKNLTDTLDAILNACVYPVRWPDVSSTPSSKANLWQTGISGDIPIVSVMISSQNTAKIAEKYIKSFLLLRKMRIKFDLALCFNEDDKYTRPCEKALSEVIEKYHATEYIKKHNAGIYLVDCSQLSDSGQALFDFSSAIFEKSNDQDSMCQEQDYLFSDTTIIRKPALENDNYHNDTKDILLHSGNGYFKKDYSYVVEKTKNNSSIPQSMVLSGKLISTVLTHNSFGYTFMGNSSLKKISTFSSEAYLDMNSEKIFICIQDKMYDLAQISSHVEYSPGCARYYGKAGEINFDVKVYIPEKLSFKVFDVTTDAPCEIVFALRCIMSDSYNDNRLCHFDIKEDSILFSNAYSEYFSEYTGFLKSYFTKASYYLPKGRFDGYAVCKASNGKNNTARFIIGAYKSSSQKSKTLLFESACNKENILFDSAVAFSKSFLPNIKVTSKDQSLQGLALEIMFNFWLPYQNAICRFLARSGFYQSSGAYGYRDQLQDVLCLMYSQPLLAKAHIIRACAHQFYQGDVLHWWHKRPYNTSSNQFHSGIRSNCSDDYLWLVYAACEYISFTGDISILDIDVKYIEAENLEEGESEKYVSTQKSDISENVLQHMLCALDRAYARLGRSGLALLGSGDWSDGLNKAGEKLQGESVWLSMFLKLVTEKFICLCEKYNITKYSDKYQHNLSALSDSILKNAYDKNSGYFARAWYDDGTIIGVDSCNECKIDLLPQSFSQISKVADQNKINSALSAAYNILYDEKYKILKLLYPPFENSPKNPGYIKGYVPGIRENGGQYTHAAVWGCMAFMKSQNTELIKKGTEAFLWQMPPLRGADKELYRAYKCEPYVLCGDIYSNKDFMGRGGWSWYTGSASWLYRCTLSTFFGIELFDMFSKNTAAFVFSSTAFCIPFLCDANFTLNFEFKELGSSYTVKYTVGENKEIIFDNQKHSSHTIPILKGTHTVTIIGNAQ